MRIGCRQAKPEDSAASANARALVGGEIRIGTGRNVPIQKRSLRSSKKR
jgi:hypothetical protein